MGQQVFRPEIRLGPEHYKTYAVVAPVATHFRVASCAEVNCPAYQNGWRTTVLADSPQAQYIRAKSGRSFTTMPQPGGMVAFTFAAGQVCFRASEHRVPLGREPLFIVRGGDHRGNPRGTAPVTRRAEDWVDDFATHQQGIADAIERG